MWKFLKHNLFLNSIANMALAGFFCHQIIIQNKSKNINIDFKEIKKYKRIYSRILEVKYNNSIIFL